MKQPNGSPSGSQIIAGLEQLSFEEIILPSGGRVEVPKCTLVLNGWTGPTIRDTYNNKALIDFQGEPLFAELVILRMLQRDGWSGVWVDSYRNKYRTDLPEKNVVVELPAAQQELIKTIRNKTGRRGGCWDVFAWRRSEYLFAESKRSKKDMLRVNQLLWLQEGLTTGLTPKNFLLVEWDLR